MEADTRPSETALARPTPRWRSVITGEANVAFALAHAFHAGKPGYSWFSLARQIQTDLSSLDEMGRTTWSLLLLRCTAFEFLARAHLARSTGRTDTAPLTAEDWETIRRLPGIAETWNGLTVAQADALSAWMGPDHTPSGLHALPESEQRALGLALRTCALVLAHPMEKESRLLTKALRARTIRMGLAALVLAIPVLLAVLGIKSLLRSPNLALHHPVSVSTQYAFDGRNPALLVDGNRSNLGFSTNNNGPQWVVIDLGTIRRFSKVVVTNRVDCCQSRAVPLKLEVSDDNLFYRPIAERTENFDTWTASGLNAQGRFIRLRNAPNNFLHLAEVEVY